MQLSVMNNKETRKDINNVITSEEGYRIDRKDRSIVVRSITNT